MIPGRRHLILGLMSSLLAAPALAREEGAVQRTGRALDRGAQRTGAALQRGARRTGEAVQRGAQRTGAALERAGNWTMERGRRVRRRVAGDS